MIKPKPPTAVINIQCNACDGRGLLSTGLDFDPRAEREAAGKSLREAARSMKISAGYLSDLELGKRAWSEGLLDDFREALQ